MTTRIVVVEHIATGHAGLFARFAAARGWVLDVRRMHAGDALPDSMADHAGLCVLGGPMSANDDVPYLRATEALMRDAMARGAPVIGHCLGGQLLARAAGASVARAPGPEIGWTPVQVNAAGRDWFGMSVADAAGNAVSTHDEATVFEWHHDSFAVPDGATLLASSAACPAQAMVIDDRHLAMQFHAEITPAIIDVWLAEPACQRDIARNAHCAQVQDATTMQQATRAQQAAAEAVAMALYARWARPIGQG